MSAQAWTEAPESFDATVESLVRGWNLQAEVQAEASQERKGDDEENKNDGELEEEVTAIQKARLDFVIDSHKSSCHDLTLASILSGISWCSHDERGGCL